MMRYLLLLVIMVLAGCKKETNEVKPVVPEVGLITENAMVVSARKEASQIGVEILKKGGNAYDAAVAVELALAVVYPYAGNLGGGGFMVYRTRYGELGTFDYREKAPMAASRDMYLDADGSYRSEASKKGALAIGVPGTVAGVFAIHEKLGSLPMEEILDPVIALSERGFAVTQLQVDRFEKYREDFLKVNGEESIFTRTYHAGDTLKNLALANTLRRISTNGRAEFYKFETADILVQSLRDKGGIITKTDLDAYEAEWREPIVFDYKDLQVISVAPPSSGGICLGQIMTMLEPFPLTEYGHNTAKYIQLLVEAERRAYADRSFFLGDPDFVNIPVDTLLSEDYLKKRMETFSFDKVSPSSEVGYGSVTSYESEQTTHFSIVDQFGNAASVTTTLNSGYGSKLYVKELGFFLNNEMDDFSAKPGEPNIYGLVGGDANAIAPQKRMLSSMTPTIVEKNDELYMIVGTPGGATIITSVLQTILNVYEFSMPMQEAVSVPRFHHQWLPDSVRYEKDRFPRELRELLEKKGYPENPKVDPTIGKVDAILVRKDGSYEGGADPRGDDTSVGF